MPGGLVILARVSHDGSMAASQPVTRQCSLLEAAQECQHTFSPIWSFDLPWQVLAMAVSSEGMIGLVNRYGEVGIMDCGASRSGDAKTRTEPHVDSSSSGPIAAAYGCRPGIAWVQLYPDQKPHIPDGRHRSDLATCGSTWIAIWQATPAPRLRARLQLRHISIHQPPDLVCLASLGSLGSGYLLLGSAGGEIILAQVPDQLGPPVSAPAWFTAVPHSATQKR